ncbi:MAG TPA: tRNA lysidine(34) synthetase TilS [Gemmatimonadales bacterium]|nr:tRNA lysidine(34) synthetase TilS [Gemmatimonadales bacterium]
MAHLSTLELDGKRVLVAVSGGPDSLALLDLLVEARSHYALDLVVAHVDHGIHPESGLVAEHVQMASARYGLLVEVGRLALGGGATETEAREHRYAWLEEARRRNGADLILTAHHADDQVETILMRVLAGSGPAGLAGMAQQQGWVVRPLLPFRRAELEEYARSAGLHPWLDPANADPRHQRSWIRTELLPMLRGRLAEVDSNLLRVAQHAAADRAAWDRVLDELPGLDLRSEVAGISVAAPTLGNYDSALTQATILALARRAGCPLGPTRVQRVISLLRSGSSGDRVPLGGAWTAELSFGRLLIRHAIAEPPPLPWQLTSREGSGVWGRWRFRWRPAVAPAQQKRSALSAWFTLEPLTVRAWAPGDKVHPLGGTGRRLIVRCFQDARVPRSSRRTWPVVTGTHDIVWVPGVCRSAAWVPPAGVEALRVDAQYA